MLHARKEPHFTSIDFEYEQTSIATVGQPKWTLIIKDLLVSAKLGIYPREFNRPQQVLINLKYDYYAPSPTPQSELNQALCYDQLVKSIKEFAQNEHIHFIETFA